MATNSVGELTMSLCAGSTDYAPGMTNIFLLFFKIKSSQDLEVLIYDSALSLKRRTQMEKNWVLINIFSAKKLF